MGKFNKPAPSMAGQKPECCSSAPTFATQSCECHDGMDTDNDGD